MIGGEKGALIGAGVGAATGAATGGYMDMQARELRQQLQGTGVQLQKLDNGQILLVMPSNITFATDSAVFQTGFNNILDSVAIVLKKYENDSDNQNILSPAFKINTKENTLTQFSFTSSQDFETITEGKKSPYIIFSQVHSNIS